MTAAVVAGAFSAVLLWAGPEVVDGPAAKDAIREVARSTEDLRYTVAHENDGWVIALPTGVELTARQKSFLGKWSLDYTDPDGYSLDRLAAELRAAGGAEIPKQTLRLTVEGRRNQPIRVDSIKPVNVRREKPYDGTLLFVPPQESGNTVEMMFDFDEADPRARVAARRDDSGEYKPGELFFQKKTLTIKDAVQDTLVVRSVASRWAVSFEIRIDYHLGNEARHVVITDEGHPFSLSPMSCADRTRLAADGTPISQGHANYRQIWAMRGDFKGIEEVPDPNRYELGSPFC
ncbi:hypothetical protein [Micromonospora zhanjiangensis]|uniref:DUF4340 domain-containing protein n=1 Tax=Micromonospora zhanjiangensis TaxID=1522057 RepID=A0ABV8KRS2_9ACTN